jgi:membrane protein required for beta-lactamase induction
MATAAVHRISFAGEDSPRFLAIGSWFVIAGPFPLALGVALDTYVATARALESTAAAASIAGLTAILLMLLWYAYPLLLRIRQR